jgi:hsp70-interacting protein
VNFVDFHKIGGFHLLPLLLRAQHSGFRWRAADLVATLTQNNPYCQQEILSIQLLPLLLQLVDNSAEEELVRIKGLYALSCE